MTDDTLPQWLYHRFGRNPAVDWKHLTEGDQSYWAQVAQAVRRAVARDGFKKPEEKP